jgi:hypothetical protein
MRISRGFLLLTIGGAVALGYIAGRLHNFYPSFSGSVPSNPDSSSVQHYYVVVPNFEALIDHKKVSANPNHAEWRSSSMPMTREDCEAELKKHSEMSIGSSSDAPQRNVQLDVTNLRRCVRADEWDSVEKYSPDPKDVFRP